jgi:uncharacterized membrane protein
MIFTESGRVVIDTGCWGDVMPDSVIVKICSVCLIAVAGCSKPAAENGTVTQANDAAAAVERAQPDAAAVNAAATAGVATNASAPVAASAPAMKAALKAAGATYQASGSEPFWGLTIAAGTMTYDAADGPKVSEPLPPKTPAAGGYRYDGKRLKVAVVHKPCEAMSGEHTNPDTVTVTVDGKSVEGCGE